MFQLEKHVVREDLSPTIVANLAFSMAQTYWIVSTLFDVPMNKVEFGILSLLFAGKDSTLFAYPRHVLTVVL